MRDSAARRDAEVAAYADRLRGEIQAHYPGAEVEIVRNDSGFGGGLGQGFRQVQPGRGADEQGGGR